MCGAWKQKSLPWAGGFGCGSAESELHAEQAGMYFHDRLADRFLAGDGQAGAMKFLRHEHQVSSRCGVDEAFADRRRVEGEIFFL